MCEKVEYGIIYITHVVEICNKITIQQPLKWMKKGKQRGKGNDATKKILVVEDNPLNREILCAILSETYQTLEAENGQEALAVLEQCGGEVALILLDVMMPVMDGYTFLHHVKENPEWALIPVIVTTQGDSEEDEVAALAHGATDFVPKPYRAQVILAVPLRGHDDRDERPFRIFLHMMQEGVAVHHRHHHVQQNQRDFPTALFQHRQRLAAVFRLQRLVGLR